MHRLHNSVAVTMAMAMAMVTFQGCAVKTPKDFFGDYQEQDRSAEIAACRTWIQNEATAERKLVDRLDSRDLAFVLINRDTMSMVKAALGKDKDVCAPGTNKWDAYIVAVHEDAATNRVLITETGSVAKLAIGVGGAIVLVDKLGNIVGDKVNGDKTTTTAGRDITNVKAKDNGSASLTGGTNTDSHDVVRTSQVQAASTTSPNSITTPAATTPAATTPAATTPAATTTTVVTP